MKHKDYIKLMKTPFDELSEQDQEKRTKEFGKRIKMAGKFLKQLSNGKINKEFVDLMEDDDPMKETVEVIKMQINDNLGAEA